MKYLENHFLFSETYIKEYIRQQNKKKDQTNDDIENAFQQIKDWNNEYMSGEYSNDPWFDYIDSTLDVLGFQKIIKNENRLIYAHGISNGEKPVAVCHFIGKEESVASIKKGKYYAYNAIKAAKENGVNWAMLTNGYQWRLYNTRNSSPYENYLEVDIEESIKNNTHADDAFKVFNLFFNVHTYYSTDGELGIEKIKDLSDIKAETIESTLRGKAEEILKELCYGLKENMGKENYTEEEKKSIYNDAIILLYRMLFFGYAESRGLLPIVENDPEYADSYKKLCGDAKDLHNAGEVHNKKDDFDFWHRLDTQLRLYVDRSYNGGLFHNEDKPILKEHRIANGRLTKCLAELSYNLDKVGQYTETIEYRDLSVRNLGSIYEGLLEFRLFVADERMVQRKSKGQVKYLKAADIKLQNSDLKNIIEKGGIYLSQDALERKETGAYYTPEDVVEYIVENTVGKKLKGLREELNESIKHLYKQLSYEPVVSVQRALQLQIDEKTIAFIYEKILSLSVIDSAMGSGHFLVNAAYRMANEILEIVSANGWESDDKDIIADIQHWKRKVVENCIYGIDINGLSVALARLSLWLISASNDKALSFIDHHLKEGNSIIGTDSSHVEVKTSDKLFGHLSYDDYMKPILDKYEELKGVGSNSKADVGRQQEIYIQINKDLNIAKKKYDYYLATQYAGGIGERQKAQIAYYNLLSSDNISDFEKEEMESLWKTAQEKNFFHWELEFSDVFQKGGFDIAIGNPPYVEADVKDYHGIIKTKDCHNLYTFILEKTLMYLKREDSLLGVILPSACVCTPRMDDFQKMLIDASSTIKFSTYDDRPGKLFPRLEHMRAVIIISEIGKKSNKQIFTTKYNRWYSTERNQLFNNISYVKTDKYSLIGGVIPKVGFEIENAIIEKVFNVTKNIGNFIDDKQIDNSVYYGYGVQYWIKAMNDSAVKIDSNVRKSTGEKIMSFIKRCNSKVFSAILNSTLFYWYFTLFSDCRNLTRTVISRFPFNYDSLDQKLLDKLIEVSDELMNDYLNNSKLKTAVYAAKGDFVYREYKVKKSKSIIDKIDLLLVEYYQLTEDEISFIQNYDIRFRLGDELSNEDE